MKNKVLNSTLWIFQIILAAIFLMSGFMKTGQSISQLSKTLPWVNEVPSLLVRFIGISELLGGIGLILPALVRFKTFLTPLAALGLLVIMLFALIFHLSRGEYDAIIINIILSAMLLFVAWGRHKKSPIVNRVVTDKK